MVLTPDICPVCKVRHTPEDIKKCPLVARMTLPRLQKVGEEFFGPSSSIFVGHVGYPRVNVGPMGIVEPSAVIEPKEWFGKDYFQLLGMRAAVIRTKRKQSVYSKTRFLEENQELVLAKKPTDVELKFKRKPFYDFKFSDITSPIGPTATLEKMRLAENPKISRKVEYVVTDELKATEATVELYTLNLDVYKIKDILSAGALGLEQNKKLVPTRWSITAVDDILGKHIIQEIKEYPEVNDFLVFESEYMDNHFLVLFMPGKWEFENFEAWAPGSYWAFNLKKPQILEEYEPWQGRTKYAEKETGGYYASRLGVLEGLYKMKRQARVVVFREVYEGYTIPLGVWQVRENVRNAFKHSPRKYETIGVALKDISSRLRLPIGGYIKQSKILKQKRLYEFIKKD